MSGPSRSRAKRYVAIVGGLAVLFFAAREGIRIAQLEFGVTLHEAAANGDDEELARLIGLRADVNAQDESGYTPLHIAAANLQVEGTRMLLDAGAKTGILDNDNQTPLQRAMQRSGPMIGPSLEVATLLLEHGADPNQKGAYDKPLTTIAVQTSNYALAEVLVLHGGLFDDEGALGWGYPQNFESMASKDPDFAAREHLEGKTLMDIYLERPKAAGGLVIALLPYVDANVKSSSGEPLLLDAIRTGNITLVHALVEHGSDLSTQDNEGLTVLHYAVKDSREDLIQFLLLHKAPLNIVTESGYTPLHYAVENGDNAMTRVLLNAGADATVRSDEGLTPLAVVRELIRWIDDEVEEPEAVKRRKRETYRAVEEILLAHGAAM